MTLSPCCIVTSEIFERSQFDCFYLAKFWHIHCNLITSSYGTLSARALSSLILLQYNACLSNIGERSATIECY